MWLQVSCEFKDGMGITVVHHDREAIMKVNSKKDWSKVPHYDNGISYKQIQAIIDNSEFCYQEIM